MRWPRLSWVIRVFSLSLAGAWQIGQADGDFGHRILGTVGMDAGSQPLAGVYAGERLIHYRSNEWRNQSGQSITRPGFSSEAFASITGVSASFKVADGFYYSAALAAPVVGVRRSTVEPPTNFEDFGFGDLFIEPLMLGWRLGRADVTASYALYAPTGQIGRLGLGQSQWTQQVSVGGTAFFDDERAWRLSALTSYNLYGQKQSLDVRQGDTVQIQGGLGGRFFGLLDAGVAGYALWQVTQDQGQAIPPALRGRSEFVAGIGPELGITIPSLGSRLTARYEWDLAAESRLYGQVLVVSLSVAGWRPESP